MPLAKVLTFAAWFGGAEAAPMVDGLAGRMGGGTSQPQSLLSPAALVAIKAALAEPPTTLLRLPGVHLTLGGTASKGKTKALIQVIAQGFARPALPETTQVLGSDPEVPVRVGDRPAILGRAAVPAPTAPNLTGVPGPAAIDPAAANSVPLPLPPGCVIAGVEPLRASPAAKVTVPMPAALVPMAAAGGAGAATAAERAADPDPMHEPAPLTARSVPDPQEPVRLHLEWTAQGVRLWIGADADLLSTVDRLAQQIQQVLAAQGDHLIAVVCNGRPLWDDRERTSDAPHRRSSLIESEPTQPRISFQTYAQEAP